MVASSAVTGRTRVPSGGGGGEVLRFVASCETMRSSARRCAVSSYTSGSVRLESDRGSIGGSDVGKKPLIDRRQLQCGLSTRRQVLPTA